MKSRYRSFALAVGALLVLAGCQSDDSQTPALKNLSQRPHGLTGPPKKAGATTAEPPAKATPK